jgi:hypothetical protein
VVHVRKDAYDIYVGRGRGSRWGNPFKIGDPHPETGEPITRGDAITLYKWWIVRGEGRRLLARLGELEGATLGCFCAPEGGVGADDPLVCHGQVLLRLLEHRRRKLREKLGAKTVARRYVLLPDEGRTGRSGGRR